jgi:hypothetical protein
MDWDRALTRPVTLCSPENLAKYLYGSASYFLNSWTISWQT